MQRNDPQKYLSMQITKISKTNLFSAFQPGISSGIKIKNFKEIIMFILYFTYIFNKLRFFYNFRNIIS